MLHNWCSAKYGNALHRYNLIYWCFIALILNEDPILDTDRAEGDFLIQELDKLIIKAGSKSI